MGRAALSAHGLGVEGLWFGALILAALGDWVEIFSRLGGLFGGTAFSAST